MIGAILRPIEGNADSVRGLAAALTSGAAKLSAINTVLVNIRAGSSWDSPAGELFERSIAESPPLLDALIDRYAGAAAALRHFAEELEEAQSSQQRASRWNQREHTAYLALEEQVAARMDAGQACDDLLSQQHVALAAMNEAQARHAAAWERFDTADQRLARRLRVLADDILDDAWHYTALTTVQGVSQSVGSLPVWARRAPILGQVTMASDAISTMGRVALRAFHDEGSWKEIGVNTLAGVTVLGAAGLRSGAAAGARPVSGLADHRRGYVGDQLSTRERFAIGTREELHQRFARLGRKQPVPTSRMVVPLDALPPLGLKGLPVKQQAQVLGRHSAAVARRKVDEAFFDNWRAVTAGGPNAQRMFVAGTTLQTTVPRAQSAVTGAVVEEPSERAGLPR